MTHSPFEILENESGEELALGEVAEGASLLRQVAPLLLHRLEDVRAQFRLEFGQHAFAFQRRRQSLFFLGGGGLNE